MEQSKKLGEVLFDFLDVKNRAKHLEDNADKVIENKHVIRNLTESEIEELKIKLADNILRLQELQMELDRAKYNFKESADPVKDEIKDLSMEIHKGYCESTETVYVFYDQEANLEQIVDANGILLEVKPLPKNHQRTFKFISEE